MKQHEIILDTKIQDLQVDDLFKIGAAAMGFETLGEILVLTINDLIKMDGFSYRWLESYLTILEKVGLLTRI